MQTLPDYLKEGLDLVLVGLNPSLYSARESHYFANPRNRFWDALNLAAFLPESLSPSTDWKLFQYGVGMTDVVKRPSSQASELTSKDFSAWAPVLREKLERYQPLVACFHGMVAYRSYLKYAEGVKAGPLSLGPQERPIGRTLTYVVPNPSPANAQYSLETLAGWYQRLYHFVQGVKGG